ncbi:MAG: gamma-glutamyltransferase family protein [Rubrivivax sp.]|nr:gamma-glutamyltransferase family protein [Rubrivivax sp.]
MPGARTWHGGGQVVLCLVLLAGCALPAPPPQPQPEAASGWTPKPGWQAQRYIVAAAHPLAADAGRQILRAGGSALDAAIAVQMVLALVEPQSSGLGGGAFMLVWDGQALAAWDGRETAPAAADERLFLGPDGRPPSVADVTYGGRAVGTPGALKMLEAAHRESGVLPWPRLFEPAIALAEDGFPVGARLHSMLLAEPRLKADPQARAYFFDASGEPWPVGHRLRNPALAALLRDIARQGSDALHRGPVAADLVRRVRSHALPGRLSEADLAGYRPVRREALCAVWRLWRVCGMPPPSSGQLALMQILGIAEHLAMPPVAADGVPGADWLHRHAEASRLAFADRAAHVADPDFVAAPGGGWASLLAPAYLKQRAALVGDRAMPRVTAGQPPGGTVSRAPMAEQPEQGTSHVSVVDALGRAVSLTSSIEAAFGARMMADGGTGLPGGFLLNNQLSDFAWVPADAQGRPVANRVQPGKRPRSSMSPTLVFDAASGRLVMAVGSAGGSHIIQYTARALLGTLAWGMAPQALLAAPNFSLTSGPVLLEAGRFPPATAAALGAKGHAVQEQALTSGTQVVMRSGSTWAGAADPRREGVASGD